MPHRVVDAACARRGIGFERGACAAAMCGTGADLIDWAVCALRTDHSVAANSPGCEPSRAGPIRYLEPRGRLKRWRSRRSLAPRAHGRICRLRRTGQHATPVLECRSIVYVRSARARAKKTSIGGLPDVQTIHSQYGVFCHKRALRTPRRASESNRGYRGLSQPILAMLHRGKPPERPREGDNAVE